MPPSKLGTHNLDWKWERLPLPPSLSLSLSFSLSLALSLSCSLSLSHSLSLSLSFFLTLSLLYFHLQSRQSVSGAHELFPWVLFFRSNIFKMDFIHFLKEKSYMHACTYYICINILHLCTTAQKENLIQSVIWRRQNGIWNHLGSILWYLVSAIFHTN
jgi:hypothetical protein